MKSASVGVSAREPRFIDLFAGCGGFSLGFVRAGWRGLFAIERDKAAFSTFSLNFLRPDSIKFDWPDWLPQNNHDIRRVLRAHGDRLQQLRGSVDAIIGGPPCQGFSFAGSRRKTDARNLLFKAYVEFVSLVRPRFVLIENVRGICVEHGKKERSLNRRGRPALSYASRIVDALKGLGYVTQSPELISACDHGVPQRRPRIFFFAYLPDEADARVNLFQTLRDGRNAFLEGKKLPTTRYVSLEEAISDLLSKHGSTACDDPSSPKGFEQGLYGPRLSQYQRMLRNGHRSGTPAQSHRFANHRPDTVSRFREIQSRFRKGVQLHKRDREEMAISKHVVVPLDGCQMGHTLTTLPDDYIHYAEARILTVREYARIQSFPDDFLFDGPFTTGGERRKKSCPRYTQVGNAVPPLLAQALASALLKISNSYGVSPQ
jgi:DNA (cytosine-5)-methyltransferase 1